MTAPWPPPTQRPVSRPPSLVLVVVGVLLAMISQFGTVFAVRESTTGWLEQLQPSPAPTSSPTQPGHPLPLPTPTSPAAATPSESARPLPEQSVGPVEVTPEIQRGVVLVTGRTPNEGVAGTGMVLTTDGYVLTNYHVVRSTQSITVTVAATGRRHTAELVGRDATKDVALLKLERAAGLQPVTIDEDDVHIGDIVVAAGNANGQGYVTAHRGNILALDRQINVKGANINDPPQRLRGLIETNAPAWPGDSGGPMFDNEAQVLGMTTAGSTTGEAETEDKQVYAVPIREALDVVDQIRRGDESGTVVIGPKGYLGIIVQTDDSAAATVSEVQPDTPAAQTGLAAGDTIVSLDGKRVRTRSELSDVLDTIEPGTTVTITWTTASGRERSGEITPQASPLN